MTEYMNVRLLPTDQTDHYMTVTTEEAERLREPLHCPLCEAGHKPGPLKVMVAGTGGKTKSELITALTEATNRKVVVVDDLYGDVDMAMLIKLFKSTEIDEADFFVEKKGRRRGQRNYQDRIYYGSRKGNQKRKGKA